MASRPLRVLLVEDDPIYAAIARGLLAEQGWAKGYDISFVHVTSLTAAVATARQDTFDCALVDLGLTDSSGTASVTELRRAAPGLGLVVLSSQRAPDVMREAQRAGAARFIAKGSEEELGLLDALLDVITA